MMVEVTRWLSRAQSVTVLDCRSPEEFSSAHIRGALNLTIPASGIALRRLARGLIPIPTVVRDPRARELFSRPPGPVVVYGNSEVTAAVCTRLAQDGHQVLEFTGNFEEFQRQFPNFCDYGPAMPVASGLEILRLDLTQNLPLLDCCIIEEAATVFPVEILPHLFLGNAENSQDLESLQSHNIGYILNVTPDLPNVFENQYDFQYLQIPIFDRWSQNLDAFYPESFNFIDEAREHHKGVLVHCLAGISRSVTITLAYLMQRLSMSLNDAYDLVRRRHSTMSPNLNFMGQLMDLDKKLGAEPNPCICDNTPCLCHTPAPPDSGIEMREGWT